MIIFVNIYNPGQKSLGQHCNIHIFVISRFPLTSNFLAVLPPPTLGGGGGEFWIHASNIVCGVRGGVGPV